MSNAIPNVADKKALIRCVLVGSRDVEDATYDFVRRQMVSFFVQTVAAHGGADKVAIQFVLPSEFGRDGVERTVRGVSRMAAHILRVGRERKLSSEAAKSMLLPRLVRIDWDATPNYGEKATAPNYKWAQDVFNPDFWDESSGLGAVVPSAVIGIETQKDNWVRYVVNRGDEAGIPESSRILRRYASASAPTLF